MAYTHEIEWQFSGTPLQLEAGVNTLLERRSDLSIRPSLKSDGRLRINFNVSEPFYQGWAVAQSRPMGTIISLHAMKEYQWSNLETVWAIIVAELRRQGWKINEWSTTSIEKDERNQEDDNNEAVKESSTLPDGKLKWYGRHTPSGKALHCTIELTHDQLFREIGKFAELVWLDLPEKDEYYYRDFQTKWVSYGEHFVISANKYRHSVDGSGPISTTPVDVIDVTVGARMKLTEVVVSYYGADDLAFSICASLSEMPGANIVVLGGEWQNVYRTPENQQSRAINFGNISSARDTNIILSNLALGNQTTTTTATTITQQTSPAAANPSNTPPSTMTPAQFNELLRQQFNESELKDICLALNIDYESLAGNSKADKTRELILHLQRRGRVPELLTLVKIDRPNTPWPDTIQ